MTANEPFTRAGSGPVTFSGTVAFAGLFTNTATATTTFSGASITLAGFTQSGAGILEFTGTKSSAGSTGAATINTGSGIVYIGAAATGAANQLAGMTSFAVNGPSGRLAYRGANTYAETATFTGSGIVESHNTSPAGLDLIGATLTDFTGKVRCFNDSSVTDSVMTLGAPSTLNATATLGVLALAGGSGSRRATQKFPNSGTYENPVSIDNYYTLGLSYTIQATNTSAATTFTGAITKTNVTGAPATLQLGGFSTQATVSGNISSAGGTLNVAVVGGAAWTLSGNNTYGGTTTITAGKLRAASNTAFGAQNGAVTLALNERLELIGDITLNKATADTTINGGTVYNVSGANTYNGSTAPLGAASIFEVAAGSLTWKPLISGSFGLTIKGPGSFKLDNVASTYTGITAVTTACTLEVIKLANVDVASSLGKPLLANANIKFVTGSTLLHTGTTADSTDRNIELTTVGTLTIDSSGTGSGAVTLAAGGSVVLPAGTNTLVFTGTNSVSNTCARTITQAGGSTTNVVKNGANTWILSGTLTHTGTTTLTAGVLDLGSTPRTGLSTAFIISGGTLQNGTDSVGTTTITATGGTIKAKLAGTTALTINSGSTVRMEPNVATTGSSEQTGAIAITASAVVDLVGPNDVNVATIGSGKMLGNGAVTCAGTIRTKHSSSSTQRGQARYKSLTLTAGARLEIGAVAA